MQVVGDCRFSTHLWGFLPTCLVLQCETRLLTSLQGEARARSILLWTTPSVREYQDICPTTGENASLNWFQQGGDQAVFEPGRILKLYLYSTALARHRTEQYSRRIDAQFVSALIAPHCHRVNQHCRTRWGAEGGLKDHRPFKVTAAHLGSANRADGPVAPLLVQQAGKN